MRARLLLPLPPPRPTDATAAAGKLLEVKPTADRPWVLGIPAVWCRTTHKTRRVVNAGHAAHSPAAPALQDTQRCGQPVVAPAPRVPGNKSLSFTRSR